MANSQCVNVSKPSKHLICIKLHNENWDALFHFDVMFHHSIDSFRNEVHNDVEEHFLRLVSWSVERMFHLNYTGMFEFFHNLQLSVFVPFVLEYFLDGDHFPSFSYSSLINDTKGPITNDSLSVVGVTSWLLICLHIY